MGKEKEKMNDLDKFCKSLKENFTPKIRDPTKPVRFWSEKDIVDGNLIDAYVIIFRTSGCSWARGSGCSMCGYFNDSLWQKINDKNLLTQLDIALKNYSGEKFVKIFTSGSFFDDKEIPAIVRKKILNKIFISAEKISVESRPEFITNKKLENLIDIVQDKSFEISIGLETANDYVRKNAINKGFTFNDYKEAVDILKKFKFKLKTYLLIKPPFLTEKESIIDCNESFNKIKNISDTISFNPTNVQKNTVVEYLWKRNQFRPSWLWSVIDILKSCKNKKKSLLIKCDVAGGGKERGAHNCRKCDGDFLKKISDFSLSQDFDILDDLDCDCKEKWLDQIDIEDLTFGSIVDFSKIHGCYI